MCAPNESAIAFPKTSEVFEALGLALRNDAPQEGDVRIPVAVIQLVDHRRLHDPLELAEVDHVASQRADGTTT